MSVIEVKMFSLICDRCGKDVNEDTDYSCWSEAQQSYSIAEDCGWLITDEGEWCNDCWMWDETEENQIPKPPDPPGSEG